MKVRGEPLKALRRKKRGLLALEDRCIAESTRLRYFTAVCRLLPLLENNNKEMDEVVAGWVENLYFEGESISVASDGLCGLHHFHPACKGHLQKAWRLFRLWRKIEKPHQTPPLPFLVFLGLLGRCLAMGDLQMASLLAIGFWGMLRTGELLKLQRRHLLFSQDTMVIQLGRTKTGLRRAIDENVVLYEEIPRLIIEAYLAGLDNAPEVFLWKASPQAFRKRFLELLKFFSIGHLFRPYSLRRGGATEDFRQHGLMERTLLKGRWGTSTAARHYVQEGFSVLTSLKILPASHEWLLHYAQLYFDDLPSVRSAPGYVERSKTSAGGSLTKRERKRKFQKSNDLKGHMAKGAALPT